MESIYPDREVSQLLTMKHFNGKEFVGREKWRGLELERPVLRLCGGMGEGR